MPVTEKENIDMNNPTSSGFRNGRRRFLEASLAGVMLPPSILANETPGQVKAVVRDVFQQELPKVNLDGWDFEAADITFPPGYFSHAHLHPGFVIGYVLEGEFRTQLEGQPEAIYKTGQMFFEPLASHHMLAGSASKTAPARILVMVFGEKGKPKTIAL